MKISLLLFGCASLTLLLSCGGNNISDKTTKDSAHIKDSIMQHVSAQQAKDTEQEAAEKARIDSIRQTQINEEYKQGLSVSTGKIKNVTGEGTYNELTMPFYVQNNTSIPWEADDYYITFKVEEEYQTEEGDLDVKWFNRKVPGKTVRPGEKITIIHKDSGWYPKDIKIKTKLGKEKFAVRFKEHTVFDSQLDKFIAKNPDK